MRPQFLQNLCRRFRWIRRLSDWPAYDDVSCASCDGLGWGRYPRLISVRGARRSHAWSDREEIGSQFLPQSFHFPR